MLMLSVVADCLPDFARTASDYARHRAGFPPELLGRLAKRGLARPGARVVDLGTGTGSLASLLAERFAENPLTIPHRVWAVTAQVPSSHGYAISEGLIERIDIGSIT
jgi:tRNA1(Val) A37 N6-methylase TrmN6